MVVTCGDSGVVRQSPSCPVSLVLPVAFMATCDEVFRIGVAFLHGFTVFAHIFVIAVAVAVLTVSRSRWG